MKKMLVLLLGVVAVFSLAACSSSEYAVDGDFTAFAYSTHDGGPAIDMVTVTVKDGKISSYNVDARQGKVNQTAGADTADDASDDAFVAVWNEKTKKELKFDYGMVAYSKATKEWFEQAEMLEAYWLENGIDPVTFDKEGHTDEVAGVTITVNNYFDLAAEAVANAKAGKFQEVLCVDGEHAPEYYVASMTVSAKGEVSALSVDVRQSKMNGNAMVWNEQTKLELGDKYGMVANSAATLEWDAQSKVITDYVLANGWNDGLSANAEGRAGVLDGAAVDALSSATIHTGDFYIVLGQLFGAAGDSVK